MKPQLFKNKCGFVLFGVWLMLAGAAIAADEPVDPFGSLDAPVDAAQAPSTVTRLEPLPPPAEIIEKPELTIEAVPLKYLDAQGLAEGLRGLLSPFGSITTAGRSDAVIICDTKEKVEAMVREIQKIDRPAAGMYVQTIYLNYLQAVNLKELLKNMLSKYGTLEINEKTNSLIVCDTREKIDAILQEVRNADTLPEQIVVDVVLVDVQINDDREMGVNWDILSSQFYDFQYRQNWDGMGRLGTVGSDATTIGNNTAYNTTGRGGDFVVISGNVRNVIHALQAKKNLQILASPQVLVMSGQIAEIEAKEEIPYNEIVTTSGGGSMSSTSFKDVGIKLMVGATLTSDGVIRLEVETEQKVRTSVSVTGVPVVDARIAKTSLMLQDGQIVVMGGLRRKEQTRQTSQIPILGDIPLLGLLFRHSQDIVKQTELLVFLSPRIYRGEKLDDKQMSRYNEMKNADYLNPDFGDRLKKAQKDKEPAAESVAPETK